MSRSRTNAETLRTVLVAGDVNNANFTGADLDIAKGGTGASSASAARTALGVVIGTDVLAPNGSGANLSNLPATGATSSQASAITANTNKTGITSSQASAIAANSNKVTNSTSASDLSSGTLPNGRFPSTLPAISGANLTNLPVSGVTPLFEQSLF